jgi:hypothetical protein
MSEDSFAGKVVMLALLLFHGSLALAMTVVVVGFWVLLAVEAVIHGLWWIPAGVAAVIVLPLLTMWIRDGVRPF